MISARDLALPDVAHEAHDDVVHILHGAALEAETTTAVVIAVLVRL